MILSLQLKGIVLINAHYRFHTRACKLVCLEEDSFDGVLVLATITYFDIYVQKPSFHYFKSETHLHARADAVEETFFCMSVNADEVAVDVWT